MLLKNAVYHKLVAKVNNVDTSHFVLKTKYETEKNEKIKFLMRAFSIKKQNSLNQKTKFQM